MELTELSLAPTTAAIAEKLNRPSSSSSPSSSDADSESDCYDHNHSSSSSSISKKRKLFQDYHSSTVDLHVKDPLPLDWEQCLDLQSGRMYYLNRKTLRKTWKWPKDQKLDLALNISPLITTTDHHQSTAASSATTTINGGRKEPTNGNVFLPSRNSNNMVALACLNCHLLVMLSTSSPSCPNCKFVHSLPIPQPPPLANKISAPKSLNTLSLLN